MGAPKVVLRNCAGLNIRDHPSELGNTYLSKAVNVDITNGGGIIRRDGFSTITTGLTNAHSLRGFLDRFAIYADGTHLYAYDVEADATTTLSSSLAADKPISYTDVADELVWTNGSERGKISASGASISSGGYFAFVREDAHEDRVVTAFPLVDLMHFYSGSMYGAVKGERFLFCSEPYKPGQYDSARGYIILPSGINWIRDVGEALLVGTDRGVISFVGHGLVDFKERDLLRIPSLLASEKVAIRFPKDGPLHEFQEGVFVLTDAGICFITNGLDVVDMTALVPLNYEAVTSGSFGLFDNSYIFSGGV